MQPNSDSENQNLLNHRVSQSQTIFKHQRGRGRRRSPTPELISQSSRSSLSSFSESRSSLLSARSRTPRKKRKTFLPDGRHHTPTPKNKTMTVKPSSPCQKTSGMSFVNLTFGWNSEPDLRKLNKTRPEVCFYEDDNRGVETSSCSSGTFREQTPFVHSDDDEDEKLPEIPMTGGYHVERNPPLRPFEDFYPPTPLEASRSFRRPQRQLMKPEQASNDWIGWLAFSLEIFFSLLYHILYNSFRLIRSLYWLVYETAGNRSWQERVSWTGRAADLYEKSTVKNDMFVFEDKSTNSRRILKRDRRLIETRPGKCLICLKRDKNVALMDCGHVVCCDGCSESLRLCPVCRVMVQRQPLLLRF